MVTRLERAGIVERAGYWKIPEPQRYAIWSHIIAEGLNISPEEAYKRIRRNNSLPIEEVEKVWGRDDFKDGSRSFSIGHDETVVYPRFNANAVLLAQASPDFHGPRGPRPELASASNILRVSGITQKQHVDYGMKLRQTTGGIANYLIELDLSASNPKGAPAGVEFSIEDIKSGIYIPRSIDKATARALGLIYGNGNLGSGGVLTLSTAPGNKHLYEGMVQQTMENAFNFTNRDAFVYHQTSGHWPKGYDSIRLNYGSKAVATYLMRHLGFPGSRSERREAGVSNRIMQADKPIQDEFLKFFLAATAAFDDTGSGLLRINDVSQLILADVEKLISERVTKHSISQRQHPMGNHYNLSLSTIPSMELFVQGYFNANPKLKSEGHDFWDKRLGFRAQGYLERTYGFTGKPNIDA